ncbi:MAG: hypothetical protein RL210_1581 [Pseudomonadota bacterium]|jgi:thiol-disulfide isomerase/thioredoxin|nr:hypothetical protein [Pseudomonadota bacterium]
MKRLVTGLISLLLSVVVQVANAAPPAAPPAARKNLDIFNVSLPDLDNKPRKLSDWRGKILVVNFWASWCGPCRDEMPEFMQLQKQYRDKGVQFVGIAADNPQAAADFARKLGINYPVLQGEETALDMMPLAGNSFGGLPYTFITNREGKIVATAPGRISKKRLEAALQPLLVQK